MRIAVVHDRPTPPWSARQLIIALEQLGVTALYVRPSELCSVIDGERSYVAYTSTLTPFEVDGVLLRDIGFAVSLEVLLRRVDVFKHLEMTGIPVVNKVEALLTARDKYLSLLILARNGIRVPRTAVVEDVYAAMRFSQMWGQLVVKPMIGTMGFGAVKADSSDIVYVVGRTLQRVGQPIYVQQYIDKPNRDIRVFVVGEEVVAAYYRVQTSSTSWKTNIAQGAKPVPMNRVDKELEDIAIKAVKTLGLDYGGVDVAESGEGYVVLEVNASPNWRGLTLATGINPAYRLAHYIVEKAKR